MSEKLGKYAEELGKVLKTKDVKKLREFFKKWGLEAPEDDEVLEAKDVKEKITVVMNPVYSVGGAFVDKFTVEEIRGKVEK